MKKILAVACLCAALNAGLFGAGTANAYLGSDTDSTYVTCVAQDSLYNNYGPSALAAVGRQIANEIELGVRNPLQERDYIYRVTPYSIGVNDANWMVNCATSVYLGYGPGSTAPSTPSYNDGDGGSLA